MAFRELEKGKTHEELMMKYLDGEELTEEEIKKGLRAGTIANKIVPVTCGSSYKNKGVQELLNAIVDYMPSPLDIPHIKGETLEGEETEAKTSDTEPFAALAFKIATDPFVGKLCFFRVYSGTLETGSTVLNSSKDKKEDIETLKPYLAKHKSFAKLYEAYGTEDIDEIVQAIEAAEQEGLSDIDKIKKELDKANSEKEDLKSQISALQKSLGDKDLTISEKEQKLTSFVEKTVVNSTIKQAAIEAGAYDSDDVLDRIKGQVKLEIEGEDYIPYVVDEKGVKRFDSNGDPVTIASLVNEFLEKRPHLRKSTLSGGAGSKGGTGKQVSTAKFTAEQLKDPKFFQEHYKEIMAEVKSGNLKI